MVLIVNGPIVRRLAINHGNNAFGQGHRPNATIGRAVRLIMMNVMNTRPGFLDRATLGNPGKYTFCFAENEDDHPWEPLHVEPRLRPGRQRGDRDRDEQPVPGLQPARGHARAAAALLRRRAGQPRLAQSEGLQPVAGRPGRRARRGAAVERLEPSPGAAVPHRARAPARGRSQARGAAARGGGAGRRDDVAARVRATRRHPHRVRGRARAGAGRRACRAGATSGRAA